MTKKIGYFLLAFVVAYAIGRGVMYARELAKPAAPSQARLIDCDPNEIRSVSLVRTEGKSLEFRRTDKPKAGVPSPAQLSSSEWTMLGEPEVEAEASVLSRLASLVCDLYNPVTATAEKFEAPASGTRSLRLTLERGSEKKEYRFDLGPIAANRQAVVRYHGPAGEESQIYASPKLLQLASFAPEAYRNLRVLRINGDQVMAATVFDGKKERFRLERDGAGWSIHAGDRKIAEGSEKATQYVNRLGTLRALAAKPARGVKCDSLPFKMMIRLGGLAGKSEALYLDYEKSGPVKACNTARDTLFDVHHDLVQYVDVKPSALAR